METRTEHRLAAERELSKRLLGSYYRLEVARAISDADGLANLTDLVGKLADPPGKGGVQVEIKRLRNARLLGPRERLGGKVYHRAIHSVFWAMCEELSERALEMLGPPPYD
jgi:hypothetical protein